MDEEDLEKIAMAIYSSGNADSTAEAIAYTAFNWPGNVHWGNFRGTIDEDRIAALKAGAVPAEQEIKLLGRDFLARELSRVADYPVVYFCAAPPWIGVPPVLVLLVEWRGTAWPDCRFFGAFEDEKSARAALKTQFYVTGPIPMTDGSCSVCGASWMAGPTCQLPDPQMCWEKQPRATVEERGDRWFVIMADTSEIAFESKDEADDHLQDIADQARRELKERVYGVHGFTITQHGDRFLSGDARLLFDQF